MPQRTQPSSTVDLATPVQYLPGCGPSRAALLQRLGVTTVRDLLFFFPRDYQDLTDLRSIDQLEEGPLVSVLGTIEEVELQDGRDGKSVLGVLLKQDAGYLRALWFNQPFLRAKFHLGQMVLLSGKARFRGLRWEMVHPQMRFVDNAGAAVEGQLLPVYPLTEGLAQRHVRRLTRAALDMAAALLDEVFPAEFLEQHALLPLQAALPQVHFPTDRTSLDQARRRLIYQELFVLQLALAVKRHHVRDQARALPLEATAKIDARIRRLFPFPLTAGQDQAIAEIASDMALRMPMNRLLQGDVGSGKTVVAVYAMLLAVAHSAQAALMAPTEILARQHFQTLERMLAGSQVRLGLLTGGMREKARAEMLQQVGSGQVQIVVGTQAVVEAEVPFANLGLVIIDEGHKFGVRQRATLKQAGPQPHYLVMTATPIPRTIAMAMFGDLDVSTLRDAPPGRQKVHTYLPKPEQRARWWEFFRRKLREGRQGYVVTPLVVESEQVPVLSLDESYEGLANGELADFRLGLVHGRMSADEKEAAMRAFRGGETQVLVATSVVEVGVDVPNATLMTIEGAERFGLAQLHQLRGRVSRGAYAGYCSLFADPQTDDARARLEALVESTDGFRLAEVDFELRGPGDLLGTRQHGLPPLRIADLRRDAAILEEARRDARALVAADPGLSQGEHAKLRRMALVRYGQVLDLGDVG
jgi:ATP-dependent DNA helicase RecG